MKTFIKVMRIPAYGLSIIFVGFIYDVLFAGIPYPDPTEELQAKYDLHSFIAGLLYKSGGLVFIVGVLLIPFILKKIGRIR
jgi:hypothetical protein